jgi:hypothetical protein
MKHAVFFLLFTLLLGTLSAQVINVPGKAQTHFQEKYPGASKVKWTNNVANYQAKYTFNGHSCKAHYSIDGDWDFTETSIKKEEASIEANDSFGKSKYRDWKLKSVALVENKQAEKLYRYEVKKGVEKNYVFFDSGGKLIKVNQSL